MKEVIFLLSLPGVSAHILSDVDNVKLIWRTCVLEVNNGWDKHWSCFDYSEDLWTIAVGFADGQVDIHMFA
mgnify:CR=1 FL=1